MAGTWAYQKKCESCHCLSAITVEGSINGWFVEVEALEKHQCTTCKDTRYYLNKRYPDEQELKFSDVVRLAPDKFVPDTLEWALEREK